MGTERVPQQTCHAHTHRHLNTGAADLHSYNMETLRVWLVTNGVKVPKQKKNRKAIMKLCSQLLAKRPNTPLPQRNAKRTHWRVKEKLETDYKCARVSLGALPLTPLESQERDAIFSEPKAGEPTCRRVPREEDVELAGQCVNREGLHWSNIMPSTKSMATLRPKAWLDDDVINFYMYLLIDRSARGTGLKLAVSNSHLVVALSKEWKKTKSTKIAKWSKWLVTKVDMESVELLLVPVHVSNVHWVLFAINFCERKMYWIDSLRDSRTSVSYAKATAEARLLADWVHHVAQHRTKKQGAKRDLISSEYNYCKGPVQRDLGPKQNDSSSCGVCTCLTADYLALNLQPEYSTDDVETLRHRMAINISRGHLPGYCTEPESSVTDSLERLEAIPSSQATAPCEAELEAAGNAAPTSTEPATREYFYNRQNHFGRVMCTNGIPIHYVVGATFVDECKDVQEHYTDVVTSDDVRVHLCPNENFVGQVSLEESEFKDYINVYPAGYKSNEGVPALQKNGRAWWLQVVKGTVEVRTWNNGSPPCSIDEKYLGFAKHTLEANSQTCSAKVAIPAGCWSFVWNATAEVAVAVSGCWVGSLMATAGSVTYMTEEEALGATVDHGIKTGEVTDKHGATKAFEEAFDQCFAVGWHGSGQPEVWEGSKQTGPKPNTWALKVALSEDMQHKVPGHVMRYTDANGHDILGSVIIVAAPHLETFAQEVWADIGTRTGLNKHELAPGPPYIILRGTPQWQDLRSIVSQPGCLESEELYTLLVCVKEMTLATGAVRMWPAAAEGELELIRRGISVRGSRDLVGQAGTCYLLHNAIPHQLLPAAVPEGQLMLCTVVKSGAKRSRNWTIPYPDLGQSLVTDASGVVRPPKAEEKQEHRPSAREPKAGGVPDPAKVWAETRQLAKQSTDASLVKKHFTKDCRGEAMKLIHEMRRVESALLKHVVELGKIMVKLAALTTRQEFSKFILSIGRQSRMVSYAMKFATLNDKKWVVRSLIKLC